jgi:crotonobetaine/carnitine-CoA ligase
MNAGEYFPIRYPGDDLGVVEILYQGLRDPRRRILLSFEGRAQTAQEVAAAVGAIQAWLEARGLRPGARVAVMLDNHPAHIALIYALILSGMTWIPINTRLRSAGIQYIVEHCAPDLVIVERAYREPVDTACIDAGRPNAAVALEEFPLQSGTTPPPQKAAMRPEHILCIIYTSGTTGAPKGVLFTHRMMRIASEATLIVAEALGGDRLFVWEPLCHIGGAQLLLTPFLEPVELHVVERFSASRFWEQVTRARATHLHYLGGILDILMQQPVESVPDHHDIRVAWGAGVSREAWQGISDRFGFKLRECYGMTECSSFATVNVLGKPGSIGRPLPWLELELLDDDGRTVPPGEIGQIILTAKLEGVLLPGYLNNDMATRSALRNGKLYTGDLARRDAEGDLFFVGRGTDSMRVRGENVSAWEVERVFVAHPAVAAAAAIGVKSSVGEQDIKLFLQFRPGMRVSFEEIASWGASRLASYQLPRYYIGVDQFEVTPSERIRKHVLPKEVDRCWDRLGGSRPETRS